MFSKTRYWQDEFGFVHSQDWGHNCSCPICKEMDPQDIQGVARTVAYELVTKAYQGNRSDPMYRYFSAFEPNQVLEIAAKAALEMAEYVGKRGRRRTMEYIHQSYMMRLSQERAKWMAPEPRPAKAVPDTQGRLFREGENG